MSIQSVAVLGQTTFDDPRMHQRGRASIDFLKQLIVAKTPLSKQVEVDLEAANVTPDTIPDDIDEALDYVDGALSNSNAFRVSNLVSEWHYRNYGAIVTEVYEDIEDELKPILECLSQGPSSLSLAPDLVPPAYWEGVFFHRTEGGWDGHPQMGYIHGEFIHKKLIDGLSPGRLLSTRFATAKMAPKKHYERILDMGCSSGHYTTQLAKAYPNAKITGVDLSPAMLQYALQTGNHLGLELDLYQAAAEDAPFEDASFDLVTSFILLHEMPAVAIRATFKEAHRLLVNGGDMLMGDVPRYADMDKLSIYKADRDAKYGGEPHWRESASLDLVKAAEDEGFVNVTASGTFPYVITAAKAV